VTYTFDPINRFHFLRTANTVQKSLIRSKAGFFSDPLVGDYLEGFLASGDRILAQRLPDTTKGLPT
jgi:hypothetical protein